MKRLPFFLILLFGVTACNLLKVKVSPDPFYSAILKQNPDHPAALFSQGDRFLRQGRYGEAKPYFDRLARLKTQDATIWFNLGRCEYELGQFDKAREAFKTATKIRPSEASMLGLAAANLMAGDLEEARRLSRQSEQTYGASAALLQIDGDIAYASGDTAAALSFYRQSLAKNANQPEIQARIKDLEEYLTSAG